MVIQSDNGKIYTRSNTHYREILRTLSRQLIFGPDYKMRKYTLLIFLSFGLAGFLIDLDHFIIQQTNMVRPLHLQVFFLIWVISIGYYAYTNRRFHKHSIEQKILKVIQDNKKKDGE